MEDIFTRHFKTNHWGSHESRSGKGSTLVYTEGLRSELPRLLNDLGVDLLIDAPCGDFNWMAQVLPQINARFYIGCDIVEELITLNTKYHGTPHVNFQHLNIVDGALPKGDLLLCRDCLFHFDNESIRAALINFLWSRTPWLLTSSHPETTANREIKIGQFAPLNLEIEPWNFPSPAATLWDWIKPFPVKYLGLWHRTDVARVLDMDECE